MATPKHRATTAVSPSTDKKPGFLKRHLGHRRRSSSVSFPAHAPPTSPQAHAHPPTNTTSTTTTSTTTTTTTNPHISVDSNDELSKLTSKGTDESISKGTDESGMSPPPSQGNDGSPEESWEVPRANSKSSNIRFTPGTNAPQSPNRHRRASSTGQSRRGSIYVRVAGLYAEGVDAGVGSKARRLSVAIPAELRVDECPLADHFSLLSRAGKKDIGEGGAAVVRLMQSKTAGFGKDKLFAVKEFREWEPDEEKESEYDRKIKSEYAIAKSSQHPNIVETYRLCFSEKKWFHVMEYCDLGDLNDIINKGYFSREDRECIFKQLLRGVEYLHSRGIAHRDLKSENLLLTKNGCLKIADFGTAEVFSGTHPGVKGCRRPSLITENDEIRLCAPGLVGSRPYMAPEIIKHEDPYDPRAVDVWSCAIVFLTLCVGGTPWECASIDVKNYNIFAGTWDAWLEKYPDGIVKKGRELPGFVGTRQFQQLGDMGTKTLVMGMLHPDPTKRWSAKDALDDKTVVEYPCCQQDGYSDDIKTRQRKALHNHMPPKTQKGSRFLKPK